MKREAGGRLNGLVLDLRQNPGGSLDEAVALSDLFLDKGQIVSQRGRARGESISYEAESVFKGDMAKGIPVVVLGTLEPVQLQAQTAGNVRTVLAAPFELADLLGLLVADLGGDGAVVADVDRGVGRHRDRHVWREID